MGFCPCPQPLFFLVGLAREERDAPPPPKSQQDVWNKALVFKLACGGGHAVYDADVTEAAPATYKATSALKLSAQPKEETL